VLTFDPHDPQLLVSGVPFDVLAQIRAEQRVCPTPAGAWYLARHDDVVAALKDVGVFRADLGPITGLPGIEAVPADQLYLSEIAEPRHGQVRRLYNACFGPHRTRDVEPVVGHICHRLLDDLVAAEAAETADLHEGYALPIPALVMAHAMGLPDHAAASFLEWSVDGSLMTRPVTPGTEPGGPPIHAFFVEQLAAERARPQPANHVFRVLIEAEVEGRPLTDEEIVTQLHFMVMAGVHTTRGLLTHVVQRLVQSPELFARLAGDRTLVAAFIEESLRHDAPVQRTTRRCTADVTFAGVELHPGDWIEVGIASANRDEAVYDDSEAFRLDRPDPREHLAFGAGAHVCPGATLARLEAATAVEVLLDRCATMSPEPGYDYPPVPGNLGHRAIPARLTLRG